jgi:mannose/cellobiose epimerase-like protein (N-acyl-D-glucosamine 2-epimerase family)
MTGIDAPTIVTERREIVKTLKNLITEHSLPLWSGEGWDPAAGGFVEKLDRGGVPIWRQRFKDPIFIMLGRSATTIWRRSAKARYVWCSAARSGHCCPLLGLVTCI